MSGILYHNMFSPPSRMALLTIRNLGLDLQINKVDIYKGEQNSSEFLKLNPLHQVPVFAEGGYVLTESKAIATYLASSTRSSLYPANHKQRGLIDSKLYFDSTSAFPALRNFVVSTQTKKKLNYLRNRTFQRPVLRAGVKKVSQQTRDELTATLKTLNSFLDNSEWFCGDELSSKSWNRQG